MMEQARTDFIHAAKTADTREAIGELAALVAGVEEALVGAAGDKYRPALYAFRQAVAEPCTVNLDVAKLGAKAPAPGEQDAER